MTPHLLASLSRLAAVITPGAHAHPRHEGLPPVLRALLEDVVWPEKRTYEGRYGDWKVWGAWFGVFKRDERSVMFGQYDGGNYGLFADWADGGVDHPTVYGIDHEEGSKRRLGTIEEFFAGLSVVPEKHVVGKLGAELLDVVVTGGRGVVEQVGRLLDDGADANATDERGITPLHAATRSAQIRDEDVLPLVRKLLAAGADPRAALPADVDVGLVQGEAGMTALHFLVVMRGRADERCEAVRLLIEAGADPNARTARAGQTPLHLCHYGEVGVTSLLVDAGGDPGARTIAERYGDLPGTTPLHTAAYSATHVAALLESSRIDVNAVDAEGLTALHRAVIGNAVEVVDALLRAGADPKIPITAPRRVQHAVIYRYIVLPAGSTPAATAELVGASAAAARLAAELV